MYFLNYLPALSTNENNAKGANINNPRLKNSYLGSSYIKNIAIESICINSNSIEGTGHNSIYSDGVMLVVLESLSF